MINYISCGDCVALMGDLQDESIDLTITSPPYDDLREYKGYIFRFEDIARQLYRLTKPGGVIVWVVGDRYINRSESGSSFEQALYFKSLGLNIHDTMIFKKYCPNWKLNDRRYRQNFEYMFVLTKGICKTFNPIMDTIVKNKSDRKIKVLRDKKPYYEKYVQKRDVTARDNVWEYAVGIGSSTDKIAFKHPAIFPEKMVADHIVSWSNPGDVILDPMCGSGTTCKMAKSLGRNFIGFDISEEYCEIARERVANV